MTVDGAPAGNESRLGAIKLAPAAPVTAEPSRESGASFDGRYRLLGYDLPESATSGGPLALTLFWEADAPDGRDYTVFVHLIDENGQLVAQSDGPPRAATYPTSIWSAGERVIDERTLVLPPDLPPGIYTVLVGLYDPASGTRLPATQPDGTRYPGDAAVVTTVGINDAASQE